MDRIREHHVLMAHFAEIDASGTVLRVLVVSNEDEARGAEFLANDLGLGGTWLQCSYNGTIRKQYPGIGYTYNPDADVFVAPQPFPSWTLDGSFDWQAPIQKPDGICLWDEQAGVWVPSSNVIGM